MNDHVGGCVCVCVGVVDVVEVAVVEVAVVERVMAVRWRVERRKEGAWARGGVCRSRQAGEMRPFAFVCWDEMSGGGQVEVVLGLVPVKRGRAAAAAGITR